MPIQINNKNIINLSLIVLLVLFGLISRILFEHSIGLQDAEWWRAWMYKLQGTGPLQIYSEFECQKSLIEALKIIRELEFPFNQRGCQAVVEFTPNHYFRTQFPIVQPQLFYLHLWLVKLIGEYYSMGDYLSISSLNALYALLISLVFYGVCKELKYSSPIIFALFAGWANPILILNGSVQLYQDTFLILLLSLGLYVGLLRKPRMAILIYGIALIFKPTVLFLMPLFLYFYGLNLLLLPIPFLISVLIHYLNGTFVSYIVSIVSVTDTMGIYGAEALGFFKLLDALVQVMGNINQSYHPSTLMYFGRLLSVIIIFFIFIKSFKLKSKFMSDLWGQASFDRILLLSIILVYFRFGLQVNHWLILLPFMMCGLILSGHSRLILLMLMMFFIQDLIYGGVYRGSGFNFLLMINQYIFVILSAFFGLVVFSCYRKLF